jgi:hypothetical protein
MTNTLDGFPKLGTADEVVQFLLGHPKVDLIKYARMHLQDGWCIALWSTSQHSGYGTGFLLDQEFDKLQGLTGGLVRFEHTTCG